MKIRRDFNSGILFIVIFSLLGSLISLSLVSRISVNQDVFSENFDTQQNTLKQTQSDLLLTHKKQEQLTATDTKLQFESLANSLRTAQGLQSKLIAYHQSFVAEQKQMLLSAQWIIVVLSIFITLLGILVWNNLNKKLLYPMEEVFLVLKSLKSGDGFRRCTLSENNEELRELYSLINMLLDQRQKSSKRKDS